MVSFAGSELPTMVSRVHVQPENYLFQLDFPMHAARIDRLTTMNSVDQQRGLYLLKWRPGPPQFFA